MDDQGDKLDKENPAGRADGGPQRTASRSRWMAPLGAAALISALVVTSSVLMTPGLLHVPLMKHGVPVSTQAATDLDQVVQWAVASGDAGHRPFVVVDKPHARVLAYEASGRLRDSAPTLLGLARGDDSVPGIGNRKMADIRPEERITPAGRFEAELGKNLQGEDIVWVDYDAAVSMHRVRTANASERRLQRLASPSIDDNRISYGCINLPPAFYEKVISPMVHSGKTVVYVLPDRKPLDQVFALNTGEQQAALSLH